MQALDDTSILLVHPLGRNSGTDIARLANIMPPLGLASLAAWLEREGFTTTVLDCYAKGGADRLLRERLLSLRPRWTGFSCTTATFLDGLRLARLVKSVLPGARTVFGGVHASGQRDTLLSRFPEIDFVIAGEGEEPLGALLRSGGEEVEDIPGLAWRDSDGTPRWNARGRPTLELDQLPFPAYEKLDGYPASYTLPIFNYPSVPNASCISSRGCTYACSYCDRSVFGRSYRCNSAAYLYAHLSYLKERFRIRHVNFYDDQFTLNPGRIAEFAQQISDRPLGMTFNCAIRADHVQQDTFTQLKAAGCWMVSLGIESGDRDLLSRHGRTIPLDQISQTVREAKKAGLRVKGLLMMGLPGETEQSIQKTFDYAQSLRLDEVNLAKFTPFPGAPLYADIRKHGAFDEDWERMDCMHFLFLPEGMTRERLESLFTAFYKAHYTRPRVLWDRLSMLWRSPDSWRRFLADLPSFLRFARSGQRWEGEHDA